MGSKLSAQEAEVELLIVSGKHSPAQHADEVRGDVGEQRRINDVRRMDAVHVSGSDIALGIDERGPLVLYRALVIDKDDTHLDDAVAARRREPGGLQIDNGVAHEQFPSFEGAISEAPVSPPRILAE